MKIPRILSNKCLLFLLQGWFDTLRVELAPENINVTMICPGPVMSDVTDNAFSDAKDRVGLSYNWQTKKNPYILKVMHN